MTLSRSIRAAALATLIGLAGAAPTFAAIIPQYDMTPTHTRAVTGQGDHADTFYNMTPIYLQIPRGSHSNSTPNVIRNTAYQYTFSGTGKGSGTGYLSAIHIPSNTTLLGWLANRPDNQNYVVQTAQYSGGDAVIDFPFFGTSKSDNEADGQDSLTTGPYASDTGAGTLYPGSTAYQAIAVGHQLYAWKDGTWPTKSTSSVPGTSVSLTGSVESAAITGNGNSNDEQVDMSPLITPPVPVLITNKVTGTTEKYDLSVAVAGSWNGGAVAMPLGVPLGYKTPNLHYFTTQETGGVPGTAAYPHSMAAITSDPTWIGSAAGLGNSVVAFGIAGPHARVVLWNVVTGAYKTIGAGFIAGSIWDATLYDSTNNTLYVQDEYGDLYAFNMTNGQFTNGYIGMSGWSVTPSSTDTKHYLSSLTIAKELTLDSANNTLYAVGDGNDLIGAFDPNNLDDLYCQTKPSGFNQEYPIPVGTCTDEYPQGPQVNSPAVLTDTNGDNTVVFDNAAGQLWLESAQDLLTNELNSYSETATTAIGSQYIGVLPDAGSGGNLIGWTKSDPDGQPALVIFTPQPYNLTTCLSDESIQGCNPLLEKVPGNTPITMISYPLPVGVTNVSSGGGITYTITASNGYHNIGSYQRIMKGEWESRWTTPPNTTDTVQTYTIKTTAVDNLNQQVQQTNWVTVPPEPPQPPNPNQPPPTLGGTGDLMFQAYGLAPSIVPGTLAENAKADPHIYPAAKLGDHIIVQLTVPQNQIQDQLPSQDTLIQAYFTQAHLTYPHGIVVSSGIVADPTLTEQIIQRTRSMHLQTGLSAWLEVLENWAGFPPPVPPATNSGVYSMTATWHAKAVYTYMTTRTSCPPSTSGHPVSASKCVTTNITETGSQRVHGSDSVPLEVVGSDWYVIPTVTQVGTQ